MGRTSRRATAAVVAERHASDVSRKLGAALRYARLREQLSQSAAASRAGISQATWSALENDRDPRYTLATWDKAAFAVGTSLHAYLSETSAAGAPRDAVQLRGQELVIRSARAGGWYGLPEEQIDRDARTSRFGDVLLTRPQHQPREVALIEIIDWFEDVGAPMRDWPRRLEAVERWAIARMVGDQEVPRVSGCWIVRATRRNRDLIAEHANIFRSRFPGSSRVWLRALRDPTATMPAEAAVLWISVSGDRLFASRL